MDPQNDTIFSWADNITRSLQSVVSQIFDIFPNLIGALVLLIFGWLIAKLVSGIVARVLKRIGLDKLADKLNQTEMFQESNLTIKPVKIIKGFIYWILLLIFVLSAAETLELDLVSQQIGALIQYIPQLLTALIILTLGFYLANAIKEVVANACRSFNVPSGKIISSVVFYVLFIAIAVTAMNQAGIDTTIITSNIIIMIGGVVLAFAIAYGFAARNVLSSILTSFYSKSSFQVGQEIEVDQYRGILVNIDNVSFTLDTGDSRVVFPLSRLLNDKVIIHLPKAEAS
ncbi:MAG: hypothetical protein D6730_08200 [Bacteroidetes bacterium]|nr:MAG: hypothetical protein D6730_08200 [Bacteroidota bacterium]